MAEPDGSEDEAGEETRGAEGGQAPRDLARLLGNSFEEPEGSPEDVAAGKEMLTALNQGDSEDAAGRVRRASTAAVNMVDDLERGALLVAAAEGHVEACEQLVQRDDFHGIGRRCSIGSGALHLAAANGHLEVCQALLACPRYLREEGVNAMNNNGQTPLDFAWEFGDGICAQAIADAGGHAGRPLGPGRGSVGAGGRRSVRFQAPQGPLVEAVHSPAGSEGSTASPRSDGSGRDSDVGTGADMDALD